MSKFKKGDKVRVVSAQREAYWYSEKIGKVYTLKGYTWDIGWEVEERPRSYLSEEDIELVKEENKMKFDMKENGWFIRYNNEEEFNLVQGWLQQNYGKKLECHYVGYSKYLTNVNGGNEICNRVMHAASITKAAKEIVLNFKTVVDSVEWPEVETEAQKELAKLQKQIEELQNQANILEGFRDEMQNES